MEYNQLYVEYIFLSYICHANLVHEENFNFALKWNKLLKKFFNSRLKEVNIFYRKNDIYFSKYHSNYFQVNRHSQRNFIIFFESENVFFINIFANTFINIFQN